MIRIAAMLLAAMVTTAATAQPYPSRPITLVVPSTPGGSVDQLAREIGRKLQERLGQPVVVDNRGGAGGIIGTEAVARAKPDGYTLLVGTIAGLATNVSLEKIRYDPLRDFAPITLVGLQDFVLCVNPGFTANSVADLVAMAKAKPRTITYASAGKGTGSHLSGELLSQLAGIELIHVPYRGVSPATMDVIGGQVQMSFASVATALPQLKVKKLKAIAVTGPRRSPMLPDLPTVAEAGIKGYESSTWYADRRAGRDAARCPRQALQGDRVDPERARGAAQVRAGRHRHRREHAAGIEGLHAEGNRQMAHGREDRGADGKLVLSQPRN